MKMFHEDARPHAVTITVERCRDSLSLLYSNHYIHLNLHQPFAIVEKKKRLMRVNIR